MKYSKTLLIGNDDTKRLMKSILADPTELKLDVSDDSDSDSDESTDRMELR